MYPRVGPPRRPSRLFPGTAFLLRPPRGKARYLTALRCCRLKSSDTFPRRRGSRDAYIRTYPKCAGPHFSALQSPSAVLAVALGAANSWHPKFRARYHICTFDRVEDVRNLRPKYGDETRGVASPFCFLGPAVRYCRAFLHLAGAAAPTARTLINARALMDLTEKAIAAYNLPTYLEPSTLPEQSWSLRGVLCGWLLNPLWPDGCSLFYEP